MSYSIFIDRCELKLTGSGRTLDTVAAPRIVEIVRAFIGERMPGATTKRWPDDRTDARHFCNKSFCLNQF